MRHGYVQHAVAFAMATVVAGLSAGIYTFRSSGEDDAASRRFLTAYHGLVGDHQPGNSNNHADRAVRLSKLAPGEHPLEPCLRWAQSALADIRQIKDYSCTVVKRERVGGALIGPQSMDVKVRHEPFSVYLRFQEPANVRGREVIYVQGRNRDKLLCHVTGVRHRMLGTVALRPTGRLAMTDNRYPITEIGILRLVERLIEVGQSDMKDSDCEVRITRASIQDRPCTCIEVEHPRPQPGLRCHLAKVYIDDERNLPLNYEAYDWPKDAGDAPELIEQYTYLDLKVNRGFSERDFDVENPDYAFSRNAGSNVAHAH